MTRGAKHYFFLVPSENTCNKNSFVYYAILDWNNLPIKIKNISNKPAFKSAVKNYLKKQPEVENWMILAMNFKFYVYSHNIYIYVPIFSGNILCLVLNIIFSHFVLYLQVMDPIGNKPSGVMGYPRQSCTVLKPIYFI